MPLYRLPADLESDPPGVIGNERAEVSEFTTVNHSVPRGDGVAKVTGSAIYASDIVLEHMAWAKVLRSPFAHARIVSIDASAAKSHPGVIDVLTADGLAGLSPYYGHAVKDHPLLAIGKVRFVGEPVAAVIAEDELSAQEAVKEIVVKYDELTPVLDVDTRPAGIDTDHRRCPTTMSHRGRGPRPG